MKILYFDKSGFDNLESTVTVNIIECGDGVCEGSETPDSCSADCQVAPPSTDTVADDTGTAEEQTAEEAQAGRVRQRCA